MNMIKTPVNGMKDIEPREMEIRQYILSKIREVYARFGFTEIETPNIEHIDNLLSDQGWDNEKLIFKILKRGEKLDKAFEAGNMNELVDSGLRYDLTVPLCRFYSNNKDRLTMPFKAMQIGNVYRADRPQKGRFRQFCQCDIDILGEATNLGEIETLLATSTLLKEIGFDKYNFSFDINDRRILKAMAKYCGFPEEQYDEVFIALDKLDKIGIDGVKQCLLELGLVKDGIEKYCKAFESYQEESSCFGFINTNFNGAVENEIVNNLEDILKVTSKTIAGKGKVVFDPSLVRGMSYYTGPIFEVELNSYHLSIGGGGRYDEMIGKYSGNNVCACGFSLGFERLIEIVKENNLARINNGTSTAILIAKDVPYDKVENAMLYANKLRDNGERVLIAPRNKNAKFQKETLESLGYTKFVEVYADSQNF